jgi:porin
MKHTLLLLLFFISSILVAQNQQKKDTLNSSLAGPNQVEEQLKKDTAPKESFFDLGFMQPYFEFKKNLKENTGFDFGIDYSSVYLKANESLGADNASSGMVRFYGSWELVNKGAENSGAFIYKVEHRHKYSSIPPKDFGFEMGYVGLEVPAFNNDGFRLTNFYWRQRLFEDKVSIAVGLLDATYYSDL